VVNSTEMVAVESATTAVAAATVAQDAAARADKVMDEAQAIADTVTVDAAITAAEGAVAVAENQATIAKQEAAIVTQAAVAAIVENEEKEKWQDEALRRLETNQEALTATLAILSEEVGSVKMAIMELVSPPSTRAPQTEAGSVPEAEPSKEKPLTRTEASENAEDGNPAQVTPEKRRRVLRFL
jgi:hypothetical protein